MLADKGSATGSETPEADVKVPSLSIGALVTDTVLSGKVRQVVVQLEQISDTAAVITGDLSAISGKIRRGEGAVGVLLNDTSFVRNLNESMKNIEQGTKGFGENMEALKHSWPFKKYFKKQGKRETTVR